LESSTFLQELLIQDPSFAESIGYGKKWQEEQEQKRKEEEEKRSMTRGDQNHPQNVDIEMVYEPSNLRIDNTASILVIREAPDQSEERENGGRSSVAVNDRNNSTNTSQVDKVTASTSW